MKGWPTDCAAQKQLMYAYGAAVAYRPDPPEEALGSRSLEQLVSIGVRDGASIEHVRFASRALDRIGLDPPGRHDAEALLFILATTRLPAAQLRGVVRMEWVEASRMVAELRANARDSGFTKGLGDVVPRWGDMVRNLFVDSGLCSPPGDPPPSPSSTPPPPAITSNA